MAKGGWTKMVDMELDDESVLDMAMPIAMPSGSSKPRYPYTLMITLTDVELTKLGLAHNPARGDMIDLRAFAVVTDVTTRDSEFGGKSCRVELQIQKLAVENEADEPTE